MKRSWLAGISIYRPEMTNTFIGNALLSVRPPIIPKRDCALKRKEESLPRRPYCGPGSPFVMCLRARFPHSRPTKSLAPDGYLPEA